MGVDLMPFADNWAYLKTELAWLDRLLMLAIARQRKEVKAVSKVAKTPADRLSSHWWKGVISVPKPSYDDARAPAAAAVELKSQSPPTDKKAAPTCKPSVGYQSQLERRIQISAQNNIVLALPSLRHYLNLTLFEKNLLLMVLAPEVNRRYGRLYHFLSTGEEASGAIDLPMVDLALRLLCRNDLERRRARAKLNGPDSLIGRKILRYVSLRPGTRLTSYLQLNEEWVDYLLSEQPDQEFLFKQLATPEPLLALPEPTPATRAVKILQPGVAWDQLILPTTTLKQLRILSQQTSTGFATKAADSGQVALFVGETGTGKTMAAGAIATSLRQSLSTLDLSQVYPEHWLEVLASLDPARYPVLLIKSASVWFGRDRLSKRGKDSGSLMEPSQYHQYIEQPYTEQPYRPNRAQLQQWLSARKREPSITMLSTRYLHTIQARWRQQMDSTVTLPIPYKVARKMMWRQAFSGVVCSPKINWMTLAEQMKISGGEIRAVASGAIAIAQAKNAKTIKLCHIQQAIKQRGFSTVIS